MLMMNRIFILLSLLIFSLIGEAQNSSYTYSDAYVAFEEENYKEASLMLSSLIIQENKSEYFHLRGDCFHKMDEFESALADYNFALQLNSKDEELLLSRGICETSLGLFEEAQGDISTYLSRYQDSSIAWYYLAVISYHNYENSESIKYLDKALAYNPSYMEALYLKAANFAEQNKWSQAAKTYEEVLVLQPDFHRVRLNLALIKMELNQYEEAIDDFNILRLQELDFIDEIYFYRAEAKYSIHDKIGACEDWQEAANLGDEDALKNIKNICEKGNKRLKRRRRSYIAF